MIQTDIKPNISIGLARLSELTICVDVVAVDILFTHELHYLYYHQFIKS